MVTPSADAGPLVAGEDPLFNEWSMRGGRIDADDRDRLIRRYSFAVPSRAAVRAIGDRAGTGVVELGAGNGYWSRLLADAGIDVVAYDLDPAPSERNPWYAGMPSWFEVVSGDESVVVAHPDRALLLVWPTKNEVWPADAIERFAGAGGTTVLYVGEGAGGRTGDDRFHAILGEYERCASCALGIPTVPCICGVRPAFLRVETIELPHWDGWTDDLYVYERDDSRGPLAPKPSRHQGRRRRGSS